jgi:hypothetical protein
MKKIKREELFPPAQSRTTAKNRHKASSKRRNCPKKSSPGKVSRAFKSWYQSIFSTGGIFTISPVF